MTTNIKIKLIKIFVFSLLMTMSLLFTLSISLDAYAASNPVCFCHNTGKVGSDNTICTSSSGEQNGHRSHGDDPYGCECGDGTCDPTVGEDCSTCPSDCGICETCGDRDEIDDGEECGERGLTCDTGVCYGCRCLPFCGDGIVDHGEFCDGDPCCADDCTWITVQVDDTTNECFDECPDDIAKIDPGICGCGISDQDLDGDGIVECDLENPTSNVSGVLYAGGRSCSLNRFENQSHADFYTIALFGILFAGLLIQKRKIKKN